MKFFVPFLLALVLNVSVYSQIHNWQRTSPGGGGAFSTIGASASGIIIAGSDLSGAYRSMDNGQSWDVIGSVKGLTETHVSGIGFHRTDGDILYIGTENGIFRSDNGGNTVNQVLIGGYITDIEFGTNVPTTGYASHHPEFVGTDGVIFKSINNGQNWLQVSTDLPSEIRILKIIVNPNNVNTVYLLSGQGRASEEPTPACGPAKVFRSTNGGVNWINLTTSLPEILDVAIDPNNTDTIYITTMNANCSEDFYWTDLNGDFYKSIDGGSNWGTALSDYTGVIWVDQSNANTIRLIDPREPYTWNVARSGTFTSTNGGVTFTRTGFVDDWDTFFNQDLFPSYGISFNGISKTLGEDLSNNNNYLWTNAQWVFRTTDNGAIFNNLFTNEISTDNWKSRGFDNITMLDMSISKANANLIYAAFFDMGIWKSTDKGDSWQTCNDAVYSGNWNGFGGNCATILADPSREDVVWASQSDNQEGESPTYLLKNTNMGDKNSWVLANNGLPDNEIMGLSLDENSNPNNRTLFVTANGDVYKSTNDGINWNQVLDCNNCHFTAVDYIDSNLIYAGGGSGLWRSENAGVNWTNISHPEMLSGNGASFWDYSQGASIYFGVYDVKTDPNNTNYVYVTAFGTNKGLFKSTDRGATWQKIITDDFMRNVAIVPKNSSVLYATSSSTFTSGGYDSNSNGIYYSENAGNSWVIQNEGMAYPFASKVAVDNLDNATVFVGSQGTGFQKSAVFATLTIDDNLLDTVSVYPNPFNNKVTIDIDEKQYSVVVFSNLGQKIGVKLVNNTLDLTNFSSGIYYVVLENKNSKKRIFRKIMKL